MNYFYTAGLFASTLIVSFPTTVAAQNLVFDSPSAASGNRMFELQGEYVAESRAVQVVALGKNRFEVVTYRGGLPGAGWDASPPDRSQIEQSELEALLESNGFQKVTRQSPTLGAEPPNGAVVLFDGSKESLKAHWDAKARMTDDGLLMEGATSRDRFQSYELHLEFRPPFMPDARGQGRGNSGVYHQGRYETQILDSFGLTGKMNETGGIYTIRDPDLNMCFPPLAWQTYDVEFDAGTFDADGKKMTDPQITVRLNGVVVQPKVSLPHATTAAPEKEGPSPGPIFLQNHGNPVRFRNIWVMPR